MASLFVFVPEGERGCYPSRYSIGRHGPCQGPGRADSPGGGGDG